VKGAFDQDYPDLNPLTLQEYNRAVRQLRRYLASTTMPCKRIILVCCVLFYCFEGARGEYDAAMGHLQAGLGILQDWIAEQQRRSLDSSCLESTEDLDCLTEVFARMDLQATIFDDSRLPYLSLASPDEMTGRISCVPSVFKKLSEAQVTLDKLQSWLFHFLVSNVPYKRAPVERIPSAIMREKNLLDGQFRRWSAAMELFADKQLECSKTSEESVKVLVMFHRTMLVLLQASLATNNAVSTNFDSDFEEILGLAEPLIDHSTANKRRGFSFETGLIAPLYLLIAKCRDSRLRSRALSLLSKSRRREGLMEGTMIVKIAERLMKLEEETSSAAIDTDGRPLELFESFEVAINATTGGVDNLCKILEVQANNKISVEMPR